MNHGSIIEQGTHIELLAKGGFYATSITASSPGAFCKKKLYNALTA